MDLHVAYGGVVPEIAARSQIQFIIPAIDQSLREAKVDWDDIDAIAVTYGAGLGSSLLIGVIVARTLAIIKDKPLYKVNHVEAHLYANFITESQIDNYRLPNKPPQFPVIGLIVSGAHSQLVYFEDHFKYRLLGQTRDDAIGEAFDKVARLIGLPYPGGPNIAKAGQNGDPRAYKLPKAKLENKYDSSFSGIKTAVLRLAQSLIGEDYNFPSSKLSERLSETQKANIAASFQQVAVETVVDKTVEAFNEFQPKTVIIGGGVASSGELRKQLADRLPIDIEYTDAKLCTDNGAMIATLGYYQVKANIGLADPYKLSPKPNLSM
jgi:N6-L-threonylcarbamoyladenine synthase